MMNEVGWVIEWESQGHLKYLQFQGFGWSWHHDVWEATRFSRQVDAEQAAAGLGLTGTYTRVAEYDFKYETGIDVDEVL